MVVVVVVVVFVCIVSEMYRIFKIMNMIYGTMQWFKKRWISNFDYFFKSYFEWCDVRNPALWHWNCSNPAFLAIFRLFNIIDMTWARQRRCQLREHGAFQKFQLLTKMHETKRLLAIFGFNSKICQNSGRVTRFFGEDIIFFFKITPFPSYPMAVLAPCLLI